MTGLASGEDPLQDGRLLWGGEITLLNSGGRRAVGALASVNDRCGLMHSRGGVPSGSTATLAQQFRACGPVQFAAGIAVVWDSNAPDVIDGKVYDNRLNRHDQIAGGVHTFVIICNSIKKYSEDFLDILQSRADEFAHELAMLTSIFYDSLRLVAPQLSIVASGLREMAQTGKLPDEARIAFVHAFDIMATSLKRALKEDWVDVYPVGERPA